MAAYARRAVLITILLVLTGCADDAATELPGANVSQREAWTACRGSDQCQALWLTCHGWHAVNRSHVADFERAYAEENRSFLSRAECDGPGGPAPPVSCAVGGTGSACVLRE